MSDDDNPCIECGGMCCTFKEMRIDFLELDHGQRYDSLFLDHEHLDQLLLDNGDVMNMRWVVRQYDNGRRAVAFECRHRTEDGLCGVYDDRPDMCRTFECPALTGESTLDDVKDEFAEERNRHDWTVDKVITERVNEILTRELDADLADT